MERSYLFVINSMGSGGAERVTSRLANYFSAKGNKVSILTLLSDDSFYELNDKVEIISAVRKQKRLKNYILWIRDIQRVVSGSGATSVIAVGYRFGLLSALAIGKLRRRPRLVIKLTGDRRPTLLERCCFHLLRRRISVIAAQKPEQVPLFSKYCQKIEVVPNPFETYNTNKNVKGYESKRFVSVGRLAKQKRFDLLIEAFSEFSKIHKGYRLDIYGNRTVDQSETIRLKALVDNLKMESSIFFHDPSPSIHELVVGSLAFVCASDSEGLPNAFIEAMLLGLPIITTNWPGADAIVLNDKNGYIVPMGDKNPLALALAHMADQSAESWGSMSAASYDAASKKADTFSLWEKAIDGSGY